LKQEDVKKNTSKAGKNFQYCSKLSIKLLEMRSWHQNS